MLIREAIRPELAPKDGNFDFNLSELEAMLPVGTVDHTVERIYSEVSLPHHLIVLPFLCFVGRFSS